VRIIIKDRLKKDTLKTQDKDLVTYTDSKSGGHETISSIACWKKAADLLFAKKSLKFTVNVLKLEKIFEIDREFYVKRPARAPSFPRSRIRL
jgi:hypothetical protein